MPRGGKHGYSGVRGGQGKRRDRFQGYAMVNSKKVTVPGLFGSAHEAAVALAQWKQQRELDLVEEPAEKKPRKSRNSKAVAQPSNSGGVLRCSMGQRMPLQLLGACTPARAMGQPAVTPVTASAVLLPAGIPASVYGVPVALGEAL